MFRTFLSIIFIFIFSLPSLSDEFQKGLEAYNDKDYSLAAKWFKSAAEKGDVDAIFMIAHNFYLGRGVEKNIQKAISYYTEATSKGHDVAPYNLGILYMSGEGVSQNIEKAFGLFKISAERGFPEAQFNVAVMLKLG